VSTQIANFAPHYLAITGDGGHNQSRHDSFTATYGNFLDTCSWLKDLGTLFYVEGNHDHYHEAFLPQLHAELAARQVQFLTGGQVASTPIGRVVGISDSYDPEQLQKELSAAQLVNSRELTILLAHRGAKKFRQIYAQFPLDLTLAGHAHGGCWRLPFLGFALVAPDEGFLPKSTSGFLLVDGGWTHLSRGSSNIFSPRLFNPPEITLLSIKPGLTTDNQPTLNLGVNLFADKIMVDQPVG
jgi:predicted MPP superfamily phosphohydrolase